MPQFVRRYLLAAPPVALLGVSLLGCETSDLEPESGDPSASGSNAPGASSATSPFGDDTQTTPPANGTPTTPEQTTGGGAWTLTEQTSAQASHQPAGQTGPTNDSSAPSDATSAQATTSSSAESPTEAPNPGTPSDEVPTTAHCAAAADWDPAWAQWEEEVLLLVNDHRSVGADCQEKGIFEPAGPLAMAPMLRCSARLHSLDMYERDFFDHTNLDGIAADERMRAAGFEGTWMGENIAYGQTSPEQVVDTWMDSPGHCANTMNPNFTLIGVGYYPGADSWREGLQHFWTQNFGTP